MMDHEHAAPDSGPDGPGYEIRTSGPSLVELDAGETGEQCIYCLRFTYEPGIGCLRCGRGLSNDEAERFDDD